MKLRFLLCLTLAACGGFSQTPIPGSATLPFDSHTLAQGRLSGHDDKVKGPLLYVGDSTLVRVYSYPRGKFAGTLKPSNQVSGMCSNSVTGDFFLVEFIDIVEYAHDGWSPINTLQYPGHSAWSCAVDPRSGDLAVTDFDYPQVLVYPGGTGTPKTYGNLPGFHNSGDCAYDNRGNLYVAGGGESHQFVLDEISKRGAAFNVRLRSTPPTSPNAYAGLQWDGAHVLLSDGAQNLYRLKVAGHKGTVTGQVTLNGAAGVDEFWLENNEVIVPNDSQSVVQFYNYPAGGDPIKTLTGFHYPRGAAVSVAPK